MAKTGFSAKLTKKAANNLFKNIKKFIKNISEFTDIFLKFLVI